jgi:hypothetical protein
MDRTAARLRDGGAVPRRGPSVPGCAAPAAATAGFLAVEATLLVPAFIVAEATLSFVGMGFPDPMASWGTMLTTRPTSACLLISAAEPGGGDVSRGARAQPRAGARDGASASLMFSSRPTRAARQ